METCSNEIGPAKQDLDYINQEKLRMDDVMDRL